MDSSPKDCCYEDDFGFAFNESYFSDRVLSIYIFSDSPESTQSASAVKVRSLHVCSPILAGRSPFFYKLFSNGMRESEHHDVTLRIKASEEDALMEVLKFMYNNTLTVTTVPAVLDVLMIADKFDVASCLRHCRRLLKDIIMTPECVLLYLDLPSTIIMAEEFRSLTVAVKQFYAAYYKVAVKQFYAAHYEDITNDLQVVSEDEVDAGQEIDNNK